MHIARHVAHPGWRLRCGRPLLCSALHHFPTTSRFDRQPLSGLIRERIPRAFEERIVGVRAFGSRTSASRIVVMSFLFALHCIALQYITLHYITLHYITFHYTMHYSTLHCIIFTLYYSTLQYITLRCITLHYRCANAWRTASRRASAPRWPTPRCSRRGVPRSGWTRGSALSRW